MENTKRPILETVNLNKAFYLGEAVYAVNNVNIQVMPGEIAIIVGPSGSGKSTLLSLLGGLDRPISGDILINDKSIVKLNEDELALMRRKNIGYVFQFFNLIPHLSALENVELPMSISGMARNEARERARFLLDEVGLTPRSHHRPDQLSGGEQQRVAIARSLANKPAVVLADEPTGNLDSKTRDMVIELFCRFNETEKQTFVLITHDTSLTSYAHRVISMMDGKIEDIEVRPR
ncbi:MAG: ABC transporter ATP-binding protein [Firmicutes bacterium]|jgi:putative ABC transport system ATP-binding protein|nr:ABC transporter ATP-binding protein [Bacillota bacterium]